MTIDAKLPDGTVLRFPDGTDRSVIDKAVRGHVTANGRGLGLGVRNALEGATALGSTLGNAANTIANYGIEGINSLAGTNIPKFGMVSDLVQNNLDRLGFPNPQNSTEKNIGRVVQGGTAALTGAYGLASTLRAAGVSDDIISSLLANPGSQTVAGSTANLASGVTHDALADKQLFSNPTADQLAKFGIENVVGLGAGAATYGGSVGLQGAVGVPIRAAAAVRDVATQSGRDRIVGQLLRETSGQPNTLAARLTDAAGQPESVPGFRPTTAEALGGDTPISSLQLGLSGDPMYRQGFDNRFAANLDAQTAHIRDMAPAGAGTADDVAQGIRGSVEARASADQQIIAQAQAAAAQRISELGGNISPERAGQIIREELASAYDAARGQTRQAYDAIDPMLTANMAGSELYAAAAPIIERFSRTTGGTPPELAPIIARLRNSNNLAIADVEAIQRELKNISGMAFTRGDASLGAAARDMAGAINGYVDQSAAGLTGSQLNPSDASAIQAARQARTTQGQLYETGAVGNVLDRGDYGRYSLANSEVPAELFFRGGGSPEATQQFIQAAGNRPNAIAALRDHIATTLRQSVTNADGSVNAAALNRWRQQHGPALNQFPELAARVNNVAEAQRLLTEARTGAQANADAVRNSPANLFLTQNPRDAVASIIGSKNSDALMSQMVESMRGNPQGLDAMKGAVRDWLIGKIQNSGVLPVSGERQLSLAKIQSIIGNKMPTLRILFSDAEIQRLADVGYTMTQQGRVIGAKALGSNTAQNLATKYIVERVLGGAVPMSAPGMQALPNLLGWFTRPVDSVLRDALSEALLNPSSASRAVEAAGNLPVNLRSAGQTASDAIRNLGLRLAIPGLLQIPNGSNRGGLLGSPASQGGLLSGH